MQAIVRGCVYHSHEMTSAAEFRTCGHCGHPITGERKTSSRRRTGTRSTSTTAARDTPPQGHPRTRVPEAELDLQILELFGRMKIQDPDVVEWFAPCCGRSQRMLKRNRFQQAELKRQHTLLSYPAEPSCRHADRRRDRPGDVGPEAD